MLHTSRMQVSCSGVMFHWRGPSPFHFIAVPAAESDAIRAVASGISYGWGCIAVTAHIGDTMWSTSLFPKDGLYLLPVRAAVRSAAGVAIDDVVDVRLEIAV